VIRLDDTLSSQIAAYHRILMTELIAISRGERQTCIRLNIGALDTKGTLDHFVWFESMRGSQSSPGADRRTIGNPAKNSLWKDSLANALAIFASKIPRIIALSWQG
jgi:hypothetical protein